MKEIIDKIGIKKIIIGICTFIGIIVLFIIGALVYNQFFYKKSYAEIEKIMVTAAEKYYTKHKDNYPTTEGETSTIKVSKLVSNEYMKSIKEYLKDDTIKCTGEVNVTNVNKKYKYTPILDCKDDYKTKRLIEYIQEKEPIVTENNGLYELNNELVYRGENVNNYITFGENNWRIVKISEEKTYIILDDFLKNEISEALDDRYNNEKNSKIGINNYELSRAKDNIDNLYKNDTLFTDEDKLLISNYNLYIGKRNLNDNDKTGLAEKKTILENQYIGLLPVYDYINASIDPTCKSIETESCNNYNYLATYDKSWWLLTGVNDNTYEVYKADGSGTLFNSRANTKARLKPVIALIKDAIYVSGDGSKEKPYKIK